MSEPPPPMLGPFGSLSFRLTVVIPVPLAIVSRIGASQNVELRGHC
jgi:hypothetical protein